MSRQGNFGWFRSIRFRLTAWYALVLFAVMVLLGLLLNTLLERELRQDIDQRLQATATEINQSARVSDNFPISVVEIVNPRTLSFPNLLIQIVGPQGRLIYTPDNLGSLRLPVPDDADGTSETTIFTSQIDGVPVRVVYAPVVLSDGTDVGTSVATTIVAEPLLQLNQTLDHLRNLLLIASVAAVLLAAVGGWFLAGRALRPVDRITETAAEIAAGAGTERSLSTRLDVPRTGDELARLAMTFNRMLDRIQDAFIAQRRFIADASHELRTPLTAIRGNLDVLNRQASARSTTPDTDYLEALADLRRESARMGRLLEDLLTLARADAMPSLETLRLQPCRLDELAAEVMRTASTLANGQRIDLRAPSPVTILADPDRIQQLLLILIDNGIRHTPSGGAVTVAIDEESKNATISVTDTGPGIAPEHLPHLFERFYRIDDARARASGGTGLGLAIAKAIAQAHHGSISVTSEPGEGSTFTVHVPLGESIGAPLRLATNS